jgi:KaiC/GvpD/RAD55 family RecA-like ATPase
VYICEILILKEKLIRSRRAMERASTGIDGLDDLIGGGLPRDYSGYLIVGPSGSGKTILGSQIQWASIQRGEPCLFISYEETYQKIIANFESFGWNIRDYMEKGNVKILDNASLFSGRNIKELEKKVEADDTIPDEAIYFVNPRDRNEYFKKQVKIMGQMKENGCANGVNVIDAVEARYRYFDEPQAPSDEVMEYFKKFQQRINQLGLHVAMPIHGEESFIQRLDGIQEGTIRLNYEDVKGELQRTLRVEKMPQTNHDRRIHRFTITNDGIKVLGVLD